jgi:hypothetical protein
MRLVGGAFGAFLALLLAATVVAADTPKSAAGTLVDLYVPVQEALAGDSVAAVKEQAAKIAAEAGAAIKAGGDRTSLEAVAAAAKGMTAADIETLREQFRPLSMALAKMVEKEAVAGHGIYYCPMADAYWVQKSGEVANPYYGKFMLRCGEQVKKVGG